MCGITGIIAFTEQGKKYLEKIDDAVKALHHRGPDGSGVFRHGNVALGHTRLAIIDTSDAASQPFTSSDERYTIVFNGEIFNYKELRAGLEQQGYSFRSLSDTEVLLTLYAKEGKECLNKLNGFFAFAVYDKTDGSLFLARDRYGEKPLYWAAMAEPEVFFFASEIKSVYAAGLEPCINNAALLTYLQLNYIPHSGLLSVDAHIAEIWPGYHLTVQPALPMHQLSPGQWYVHPGKKSTTPYAAAVKQLRTLLEEATQRRLIADVPVGAFLSGGVDSSCIAALAKQTHPRLETFSVGYADEPFFDETKYAQAVADHIGSTHHVFSLRNNDLLDALHDFLSNIDEPFADSSALAVNALSKQARRHVTVALSGDGADEIFAGYNKHAAEYRIRNAGFPERMIRSLSGLWNILPASRNSPFGNRIRQFRKFSEAMKLNAQDRYWQLASIAAKEETEALLFTGKPAWYSRYDSQRHYLIENIGNIGSDLNDVLMTDVKMVLEGDMLVKVDRMSMQHGLEVRSPFLDHEVMEFAMSLPSEYKINRHERKRILKDACRDLLPAEIFTRSKKGFEVPLLKWFRNDLRGMIDELLDEKFLKEQNLFNPAEVKNIRKQLHSNDPGDSAARIWGLIVFQSWWKKFIP